MKYAITGHTSGIGKRLYERLSPNAVGFSRSTGYDLNSFEDRKRIIAESEDCDVFVNNAYDKFCQTHLLIELFQRWRDKNKTIINIGSRVAEIPVLPIDRQDLLEYQASKLILKEMSQRLVGTCKVTYKSFGYVGTEKIIKKYPHFTKFDFISEDQAVDIILL